ncbi:MAG: hypothetical protein KDA97_04925, partial [Acidimicrobiales bacterium]|nr:hypothetical protein [Acidimicrobiales bacterium]
GPYLLAVPLAAVAAWLVAGRTWSLRRTLGGDDGRLLAAATVLAAVAYGCYVVRVGGDYMHGRMLLPPIVALCCPIAVVALPTEARARAVVLGATAVTGLWALGVGLERRAPVPTDLGPTAIAAQRPFYVGLADTPHPVTADDYARSGLWEAGLEARRAHEAGDDVLVTRIASPTVTLPVRTELDDGRGTWLFTDGIGVFGLAAGIDVPVIDHHGLAHPLASRMPPVQPRVLPGHEKELPEAWALAEAGGPGPDDGSDRALAAAARSCGPARRVLDATEGDLTVGRLWSNLWSAPGLTVLDIPADPGAAVAACDGTRTADAGVGGSGT